MRAAPSASTITTPLGVVIVEGEGAVLWVNLERPIVTSVDYATQLFPNYFGQDLFAYDTLK